ncbi:hypothetical protein CYCD_30640 [Tenuifilaceae bacterium CYCD]|nr:hypothetical protein CYCD_30640 [Tenuifilaceae bacterium CYCD]
MKIKKIKIPSFIKTGWFSTLISTMIGVFAGFYLNNYNSERKLTQAKSSAFQAIANEIDENKKLLASYDSILQLRYKPTSYLVSKINSNFEIVIPRDSLDNFKNITRNIFTYHNHIALPDGNVRVKGEFNLELKSILIVTDLSHIIWDAYKQTEYLSITKFDCIVGVERAYLLIGKFNADNEVWRKQFVNGSFLASRDALMEFMQLWNHLNEESQILLQYLGITEEIIAKEKAS